MRKIESKKRIILGVVTAFFCFNFSFAEVATTTIDYSNLKWYTAHYQKNYNGEKILNTDNEKDYYFAIHLDLEYPQFIGTSTRIIGLNNMIKKYVFEIPNYNLKLFNKNMTGEAPLFVNGKIDWLPSETNVNVETNYKVISIRNNVVSILFDEIDFSGGGNGNHHNPKVLNFNLLTGKKVTSKDIFCKKDSREKIINLLLDVLVKKYSSSNEVYTRDYFAKKLNATSTDYGSREGDVNYHPLELITFGNKNLNFVFSPYTLVSGSEGTLQFSFPYKQMKSIVCVP